MLPDVTKTYVDASGGAWENRELPASVGQVLVGPDGYSYRLCRNKDAVAVAQGDVVCFTSDDDLSSVSSDRAGGTSTNTRPAGQAMAAAADEVVFWVQCTGIARYAAITDGGVGAEESLIAHATTNGGLDTTTAAGAGEGANVVGKALNADTSTTLAIGDLLLACTTVQQQNAIA